MLLLDTPTTVPPVGAATVSVTVPIAVAPALTVLGAMVIALTAAAGGVGAGVVPPPPPSAALACETRVRDARCFGRGIDAAAGLENDDAGEGERRGETRLTKAHD